MRKCVRGRENCSAFLIVELYGGVWYTIYADVRIRF